LTTTHHPPATNSQYNIMSVLFNKSPRLILVRHGESMWNVTNKHLKQETRFTGWADIPLSAVGAQQASASGRCLASLWTAGASRINSPDTAPNNEGTGTHTKPVQFHSVYTSMLERSRDTYNILAAAMEKELQEPFTPPVTSHWRLNERHYGALVGLSKSDSEEKLGAARVTEWRRSWNIAPPPMYSIPDYLSGGPIILNDATIITHANNTTSTTIEAHAKIPRTESLQDCVNRVIPLLEHDIYPRLKRGENVLVVAHSNTIRG
jgi:2,3-bisphosphoglycerate-dependent phosphoglycerate mutase